MRKLGLAAVVALFALLAGCGGSTKTVTVATPSSGSSSSASSTPAASAPAGASTTAAAAVGKCFTAAGAAVRGPHPAGEGVAVYATTRDSGNIGFVKAPSAAVAIRLAQVFPGSGWKVRTIKSDATGFAIYQGTLTSSDSTLLSKCAK